MSTYLAHMYIKYDHSLTKEEITKQVFDAEVYINDTIALDILKKFGILIRVHIEERGE
jgi:hypothetical protein